jgi:nucleotide-binding universal stress UspA family protein
MPKEASMQSPKPLRRALAVAALAVLSLTLAAAAAGAHGDDSRPSKHRTSERLVVRGDSTVTEVEDRCDANGCQLRLEGGQFRGTLGTGQFSGTSS